jgi:hypothetical protein
LGGLEGVVLVGVGLVDMGRLSACQCRIRAPPRVRRRMVLHCQSWSVPRRPA